MTGIKEISRIVFISHSTGKSFAIYQVECLNLCILILERSEIDLLETHTQHLKVKRRVGNLGGIVIIIMKIIFESRLSE